MDLRMLSAMVRIVLILAVGKKSCARPGATRLIGRSLIPEEDRHMDLLWALAFVFIVLWMLGFFAFHVTSGLIHLLLVIAVVAVVFRLVTGRRLA
jgi:hypothetical protein